MLHFIDYDTLMSHKHIPCTSIDRPEHIPLRELTGINQSNQHETRLLFFSVKVKTSGQVARADLWSGRQSATLPDSVFELLLRTWNEFCDK